MISYKERYNTLIDRIGNELINHYPSGDLEIRMSKDSIFFLKMFLSEKYNFDNKNNDNEDVKLYGINVIIDDSIALFDFKLISKNPETERYLHKITIENDKIVKSEYIEEN